MNASEKTRSRSLLTDDPGGGPEGSFQSESDLPSSSGLPLWSTLNLRVVGLGNSVGLLLQVGVGVGALLPRGGSMLEIVVLNVFHRD
eukprot:SAG31_NODE_14046_length_830_cov_1.125855_1_plen_87_part_00